jgi:hypothetical protein
MSNDSIITFSFSSPLFLLQKPRCGVPRFLHFIEKTQKRCRPDGRHLCVYAALVNYTIAAVMIAIL